MNSPAISANAADQGSRLAFDHIEAPKVTHSLFRYPAKFHPPVAHHLIQRYTVQDQLLFDPFCGSGTLCVAASLEERHSLGCDIDPVAAFVARVKTHRYQPQRLSNSWDSLKQTLKPQMLTKQSSVNRKQCDITDTEYLDTTHSEGLWIPHIPNIFHWFRRHVTLDLARIYRAIRHSNMPKTHQDFFRLIFASILRKASNADPVPVSGLEVTAYMRRLEEAGRFIDPYALFFVAVEKGLARAHDYWKCTSGAIHTKIIQADVTRLPHQTRNLADVVITSPPYHNAVDYYRRHQLEMYWLGLVSDHASRLQLLPNYIGRPRVRKDSMLLSRSAELGYLASQWETRMRNIAPVQADAFVHYMVSMGDALDGIADSLKPNGELVMVVGDNQWRGEPLPTSMLLAELLERRYTHRETSWYPLKNRYMSYARRNGADISREYVLVYGKQN